MEARPQSERPPSTEAPDAVGCDSPLTELISVSFVSQWWRRGILYRRDTKDAEGPGHGIASLGRRRSGGVRLPGRHGDWGPPASTEGNPGSNHPVEANRRPTAPPKAGSPSGGSSCSRPLSPAAVASPHRSAGVHA